MNESPETHPIVLFDGVCNFCNGAVNFIIERDRTDRFRFAALQSEAGKVLIERFRLESLDSIILVEGDRAYVHSTAALRIARHLGIAGKLLYAGIIVPKFIRDFLYKTFAANRYRLFGRKDECMIPTPGIRSKFLN